MKRGLIAFAGLLAISVSQNVQAQSSEQPKLSTKSEAGLESADASAKTLTTDAGSKTKASNLLLSVPAGTYSLETRKVMTASTGSYGYQMMGASLCQSGCGTMSGYTTYVPAPVYYVPVQVYTPAYMMTAVPMGSGMSFGSMGGSYGGFGGMGYGSMGGMGGFGGGMGGGGGTHMRYPYYSYRHPWYTRGPMMQHRTIGSW